MKLRTVGIASLAFCLGAITIVAAAMRKLVNDYEEYANVDFEDDHPEGLNNDPEDTNEALARSMIALGYVRGADDGGAQVWRRAAGTSAGGVLSRNGYADGADFNPWDNDPMDMLTTVVGPYEDSAADGSHDDDIDNEGDDGEWQWPI